MEHEMEILKDQIETLKEEHKRSREDYQDKLKTAARANQQLKNKVDALKVMSFDIVIP